MTFSSVTYLVFFTIVCAFMALTNLLKSKLGFSATQKIRHTFLLIASYIFYGLEKSRNVQSEITLNAESLR